jgi:hypothetical protein
MGEGHEASAIGILEALKKRLCKVTQTLSTKPRGGVWKDGVGDRLLTVDVESRPPYWVGEQGL